ncbi:tetratricopeptide repeat protein [Lentisphaera profundi]|uniref:Tetratricopeptide repeat protein n=1 Tax=Lentisphaera profundi TaxID=1658616 RepID=A0ABY7VVK3_9BACT|nr:tetratricopeptide repeat protein [Lentisphaera profundi]WDE98256.1 tetratricopeptide repeat protein [Lentisphaera profundi]
MTNKAIIALLTCLCAIIFSTLLLLKKDVKLSNVSKRQQIPFEVQSATAQGLILGGKYEFANKIFANSYQHFKDNPAYIQSYANSLLASEQAQKAQNICLDAINIYPLNKNLRLTLAKCMLSNKQSDSAYRLLNELPLFSQKEADYLSLIIMTTPNKSGLESLMSKMKNFTNYQKLFPKNLIEKSPNSEFIIKNLSN